MGCVVIDDDLSTRHSQTREQVVTKRPTISIIGGETNLRCLPYRAYGPSQTVNPVTESYPEHRGKQDEDVSALVDGVHCHSLLWLRRVVS